MYVGERNVSEKWFIIRSTPANANDSIYCHRLGTGAVHAAMAGKTEMIISMLHNRLVHVPTTLAVKTKNTIDPEGPLWRDVLEATGQPQLMINRKSLQVSHVGWGLPHRGYRRVGS